MGTVARCRRTCVCGEYNIARCGEYKKYTAGVSMMHSPFDDTTTKPKKKKGNYAYDGHGHGHGMRDTYMSMGDN